MDSARVVPSVVAGVVVLVLVLSGPAVGVLDLSQRTEANALGDGTADIANVTTADSGFRLDAGRFGTNVTYLRIPSVTVDFASTTGRFRLVYRVESPDLGFDRVGTKQVSKQNVDRVSVGMRDRAFRRDRATGQYRVQVTVRVQSFAVDETVAQWNATVGGDR
jgi:hypothetical protein